MSEEDNYQTKVDKLRKEIIEEKSKPKWRNYKEVLKREAKKQAKKEVQNTDAKDENLDKLIEKNYQNLMEKYGIENYRDRIDQTEEALRESSKQVIFLQRKETDIEEKFQENGIDFKE